MAKKKKTKRSTAEDPPSQAEERAVRSSSYGEDPGIKPYYINSSPGVMTPDKDDGIQLVEDVEEVHEEDEEEREFEMEEDVYTLMFVYGCSFTTVYAVITVLLQLGIVGLFYIDLLQDNTEVNKLNLPVAVDGQGTFCVITKETRYRVGLVFHFSQISYILKTSSHRTVYGTASCNHVARGLYHCFVPAERRVRPCHT
jgi:hypothetical protein